MKEFTLNMAKVVCENQNTKYPISVRIKSVEDLQKVVQFDHVMGTFKDKNTRSKKNFLRSDVLFADIDNSHSDDPEDWITIDRIKDELQDVQFYLVPSKSHLKGKENESPREKFHIYFPIEEVSDESQYSDLLISLMETYKHFQFDRSCKNSSRHWNATTNSHLIVENDPPMGRLITEFIPEKYVQESDSRIQKVILPTSDIGRTGLDLSLASTTRQYFEEGTGLSDGRKRAMYKLACSCKSTGLDLSEMMSVVSALNDTFDPPHNISVVKREVENAESYSEIPHGLRDRKNYISANYETKEAHFEDRLKIIYDMGRFSKYMLNEYGKYEVNAIGFSAKGSPISNMQSLVIRAYDEIEKELDQALYSRYTKWIEVIKTEDPKQEYELCCSKVKELKRELKSLEDTNKKHESDVDRTGSTSGFIIALKGVIESKKNEIKFTENRIEELKPIISQRPPKNLKDYLKRKGLLKLNQFKLNAVATLVVDRHDSTWVEKLKKRIVVEGDYEKQRMIFRDKLNLSDQESKVIGKWIQNVKHRVIGKGNRREFIVLLASPDQGTGKSLFTKFLTTPIDYATQEVSSDQFKDKGLEASLATTAVMVVNELKIGYQSGGDLELLKRLVTQTKYSMRKVYATNNVEMTSICSFLASSNNELSDIVLDTENRRFYPIPWGRDRLKDILDREKTDVYKYYQTVNWTGFFNSVPIEGDVWQEEDYDHFDLQSKKNVKAEELEEYLLTHGEKMYPLRLVYGDRTWISATAFLDIYNEHRAKIGIKTIGHKVLKRDMTILGAENKKLPPLNISYYDLTEFVHEIKAVQSQSLPTANSMILDYQEVEA